MWPRMLTLGLRGKMLAMMFGLLMLILATLFLLYWRAEIQLISQVERHTTDLSTAIQISVEQLTSRGRTTEARLNDYVQRLQRRGVREISIVSNEEEVIASSNPRRVGVRVDPRRKDLLITARLGEGTPTRDFPQRTYNLIVPIVVNNQRSGYILISMILDDFAELSRINFLKRLVATVLVFGVGMGGAVVLAWTYHKPIFRVVEAAQRVAQGHLEERLPVNRRDEIGELNRSFNEMVDGLRQKVDLEARLHRAERLSAIAHLASGIAHEVRNPLSTISMTIGHLAAQHAPREPEAREEFQRLTSMMMGEIGRLNEMIETFLKYGKPLKLERRACNLSTLLDEVMETAAPRAAAQRVRLRRTAEEGLPPLWADPVHLKTCFVNLALNALQAMPEGGELSVATRRGTAHSAQGTGHSARRTAHGAQGERDGGQGPGAGGPGDALQSSFVIRHSSIPDPRPLPSTDWVEVELRDTGIGISEENLGKIFEPYFTTKEVGIGLGLALTRKIIEEHGGEISLTSTPGKGTVACVRLPAGVPGE
ncbi:MAG: HAMP domain-containing protein [candidate division NC10 bacterium]|nr:HAMP domain-containing protein [candidate division NC10 bacterium]